MAGKNSHQRRLCLARPSAVLRDVGDRVHKSSLYCTTQLLR